MSKEVNISIDGSKIKVCAQRREAFPKKNKGVPRGG